MTPLEHDKLYAAETRHFWFQGTRTVILSLLRQALGPRLGTSRLLDIGCGTGYTLTRLPATTTAVGIDSSRHALRLAQRRAPKATLVQGDAYRLPFAENAFDAILALDVLEHLDDDIQAASEVARVLRPGGAAIFTVPAFAWLWNEHDEALSHRRRYRLAELETVLSAAGFTIQISTYYNTLLFPLVVANRLWSRRLPRRRPPRSALTIPPEPVNRLFASVLAAESHLVHRVRLPLGVSCLALVRDPSR